MGVENHHPLSSEKVTCKRTMLRELGGGSLPLGDHKRVHGETTQSVKCVPCKHEDLCLIPKTRVKKKQYWLQWLMFVFQTQTKVRADELIP